MTNDHRLADDTIHKDIVLKVEGLRKYYPIIRGMFQRHIGDVKAVDGVSFNVYRRETLALVGESGCGKTTTGRCIIRAIEPTAGSVRFYRRAGEEIDLVQLSGRQLRSAQRDLGMIFQDPYSSLNPRLTVLESIGEPFITRKLVHSRKELENRVASLLQSVRLDPSTMSRYPHAFSGGQRQRIAIARALALNPEFVIADEPVSALDVSVQAQILSLLKELQTELGLAYLFITHNLAVIEYISHRVAVMYVGEIVEMGETEEIFRRPRHPYTEALLSAVPVIKSDGDGRRRERIVLAGDIADPSNVPAGCPFHPRCPYVVDICRTVKPAVSELAGPDGRSHSVRCHFANELQLQGVHKARVHGVQA